MPPLQAVLGPALQNTFGHDTVHSVLGAVRSVGLVVTAGGSSLAQALLPPNTTGASIPWDEIGPATKELLQRLLRVLASITPEQAIGVGAVAVYVPLALLAGPFWPIVLPLRICGFTLGGVAKGSWAAAGQATYYGGYVPARSIFAFCQHLGATLGRGRPNI